MRITGIASAAVKAQANLQQAFGQVSKSVGKLASGGSSAGFAQDVVSLGVSEVAAKASTQGLKIILQTEKDLVGALLDKQA